MARSKFWVGLCLALTGCAHDADSDAVPVFDVVLKHEFPAAKKDMSLFVFIDGKDPSPDLLKRIRETWPGSQAGSKVGKDRVDRVDFGNLKWVGREGVELDCTISNGMDGRRKHFKLARKKGVWVVEKAETTAES